jgi:hypothetical protein
MEGLFGPIKSTAEKYIVLILYITDIRENILIGQFSDERLSNISICLKKNM